MNEKNVILLAIFVLILIGGTASIILVSEIIKDSNTITNIIPQVSNTLPEKSPSLDSKKSPMIDLDPGIKAVITELQDTQHKSKSSKRSRKKSSTTNTIPVNIITEQIPIINQSDRVIISLNEGTSPEELIDMVTGLDTPITGEDWVSANIDDSVMEQLILMNSIEKIEDDRILIPMSSTNQVSSTLGIMNGSGHAICHIDTGIDYTQFQCNEPDFLSGLCTDIPGGHDFCSDITCAEDNNPNDVNGHGTESAKLIKTIIPKVSLLPLKVTYNNTAFTSSVINAVDWCIDNKDQYNITTVYIGVASEEKYTDPVNECDANPLYQSIQKALNENISVISSAGNTNNSLTGISFPGCLSNVISAGQSVGKVVTDESNRHRILDLMIEDSSNTGTSYSAATLASYTVILQQYNFMKYAKILNQTNIKDILIQTSTSKATHTYDTTTWPIPNITNAISEPSFKFDYDSNGNILTDGKHIYEYNDRNQLVNVKDLSGKILTTYVYDYDGSRIKKIDDPSNTNKTTYYIGDMIAEMDNNTYSETRNYFFNGKLVVTEDNTSKKFYHTDHLGSINVITDDKGQILQRLTYNSYGYSPDESRYMYTGQEKDSNGLMYYSSRYYNPFFGRFTQPDTIIPDMYNPQSFNKYSYVYNNPIKYTDPEGETPWSLIAGVVGAGWNAISQILDGASMFGWTDKKMDWGSVGRSGVSWGVGSMVGGFMGKAAGNIFNIGHKTSFAYKVITGANVGAAGFAGFEGGRTISDNVMSGRNIGDNVISNTAPGATFGGLTGGVFGGVGAAFGKGATGTKMTSKVTQPSTGKWNTPQSFGLGGPGEARLLGKNNIERVRLDFGHTRGGYTYPHFNHEVFGLDKFGKVQRNAQGKIKPIARTVEDHNPLSPQLPKRWWEP